ncbi:U32 family peptidase [Proteiniborus sp. MB09-C3]|uniref:U32 family peptidase n=1 Tax=Proteiniborus sp. MB09-C3 TaxID=3050072 RepID=UPI002555C675|nr:U32 family peptidase [Proteiniborus sp. MB09-C3]WIV11399.1 U32 family peptidase [Proteiniborus sp. MB09-C3]
MIDKIEILAPVGSMEALYAAVENGANAVYLGGKMFNARQYASNFSHEDLKNAVEYAHLRDVKVYVTLNILLDDNELKEVIDYLIFLYNIDVDALIVQDLGLARIIRELLPDFQVHASTQMSINNYLGVQFLEGLGFKRVVLARELSVDEIRYIKEKTNIEIEAFIHGALCVCYSGQCLMSSMIGGRSGNRGRCAQPCRMAYSIVDVEKNKVISPKFEEKYILSPKDLNTIEYLEEIINSGVVSLKIEGRMKKPEYVAVIVNRYRKELDRILGKHSERLIEKDFRDIAQMFNRGFTKGYIAEEYGKKLISFDKPNNRGIFIGEVIRADKNFIHIGLEDDLNKGDGIEIIDKKGEGHGQIVDKIIEGNEAAPKGNKGKTIKIKYISGVEAGSKVYKTFDLLLNAAASETYTSKDKLKRIKINMAVEVKIEKPVRLVIWQDHNYVNVLSDEVPEKGIKLSLDKEKIIKQMNKLGDTPYIAESIDIELEEGAMIPVSVLNGLRRKGIEELNKKRSNFNHRIEITAGKLEKGINQVFDYSKSENSRQRKTSVKIDSSSQFKQLDLNKLDRIYLDYNEDVEDQIKEVKKYNKEIYISTEKIISNEKFDKLKSIFDKIVDNIDGISASNIGTLEFIKNRYETTNIHCDIGFNIFNSSIVKLLAENKVSSLTLSPELKLSQISNICKNNSMEYEAIGYGYFPLMTTRHCPMSLVKGCKNDQNCSSCELASGYGLYDRKGMTFEMKRKGKSTIIYNSQPLIIVESSDKIFSAGVDMMRLDFTIEKDNIKLIQELYYNYINDKIDSNEMQKIASELKKQTGNTTGHFFRGVL